MLGAHCFNLRLYRVKCLGLRIYGPEVQIQAAASLKVPLVVLLHLEELQGSLLFRVPTLSPKNSPKSKGVSMRFLKGIF